MGVSRSGEITKTFEKVRYVLLRFNGVGFSYNPAIPRELVKTQAFALYRLSVCAPTGTIIHKSTLKEGLAKLVTSSDRSTTLSDAGQKVVDKAIRSGDLSKGKGKAASRANAIELTVDTEKKKKNAPRPSTATRRRNKSARLDDSDLEMPSRVRDDSLAVSRMSTEELAVRVARGRNAALMLEIWQLCGAIHRARRDEELATGKPFGEFELGEELDLPLTFADVLEAYDNRSTPTHNALLRGLPKLDEGK